VAQGVVLPDTSQFIELTSGSLVAGGLTLDGFQAFVDASAGGLIVSGLTTVAGNSAFVDATGPGSNSLGGVILSGTSAFLQQNGGSSGPLLLNGSSAFWNPSGAVTVNGNPAAQVTGTSFLSGGTSGAKVTLNGDVIIGGTAAFFSPNTGDKWTINGDLSTTGGGTLVMNNVADTIEVNGNVSFGGGDESASLVAGILNVSGNFSQTGPGTTFIGSGAHTVFLDGTGAQTLTFAAPGFGAGRFQNVIIANSAGGVTATSDLYAHGHRGGVTPTAVRTLSGNGSTLFTTILNVSNFTFNNLLLDFNGSTVVTFDTVSFTGYAPTATPLTITHPGAASALAFQDVSFSVVPTSGFYLDATDSNPSDGVPLVIDMLNPNPLSDGGRGPRERRRHRQLAGRRGAGHLDRRGRHQLEHRRQLERRPGADRHHRRDHPVGHAVQPGHLGGGAAGAGPHGAGRRHADNGRRRRQRERLARRGGPDHRQRGRHVPGRDRHGAGQCHRHLLPADGQRHLYPERAPGGDQRHGERVAGPRRPHRRGRRERRRQQLQHRQQRRAGHAVAARLADHGERQPGGGLRRRKHRRPADRRRDRHGQCRLLDLPAGQHLQRGELRALGQPQGGAGDRDHPQPRLCHPRHRLALQHPRRLRPGAGLLALDAHPG
jgi:hypothetical protein